MRLSGHDDPVLNLLGRLPDAVPDPSRTTRVRSRMYRALRRQQRARSRRQLVRRRLEAATVAGFSLAYVAVLVREVLRWRGIL